LGLRDGFEASGLDHGLAATFDRLCHHLALDLEPLVHGVLGAIARHQLHRQVDRVDVRRAAGDHKPSDRQVLSWEILRVHGEALDLHLLTLVGVGFWVDLEGADPINQTAGLWIDHTTKGLGANLGQDYSLSGSPLNRCSAGKSFRGDGESGYRHDQHQARTPALGQDREVRPVIERSGRSAAFPELVAFEERDRQERETGGDRQSVVVGVDQQGQLATQPVVQQQETPGGNGGHIQPGCDGLGKGFHLGILQHSNLTIIIEVNGAIALASTRRKVEINFKRIFAHLAGDSPQWGFGLFPEYDGEVGVGAATTIELDGRSWLNRQGLAAEGIFHLEGFVGAVGDLDLDTLAGAEAQVGLAALGGAGAGFVGFGKG
jgi:hypothetical protein